MGDERDQRRSAPERSAEELACDAQAGSSQAFEALVLRFHRPLFRFLVLRAGTAEDAEDLTQESFVRAWQQIARYDPRHRFSTWLFTLGRRLAASRARASASRPAPCAAATEPASNQDPPELASAREERENLWSAALRVLGPERTSALWLRYAEDLPAAEIARILGRRETTVRVILFRSRVELARHLERAHGPDALPLRASNIPARLFSGGR